MGESGSAGLAARAFATDCGRPVAGSSAGRCRRGLALAQMDSDDPAAFWEAERGRPTCRRGYPRGTSQPTCAQSTRRQLVHSDGDRRRRQDRASPRSGGRSLPLDEIASGPGTALGLGPEYRGHQALGFVVQGLRRFPGQGWPLISAALRSQVVNNRNMAMNVLEAWGRPAAPAAVDPSVGQRRRSSRTTRFGRVWWPSSAERNGEGMMLTHRIPVPRCARRHDPSTGSPLTDMPLDEIASPTDITHLIGSADGVVGAGFEQLI